MEPGFSLSSRYHLISWLFRVVEYKAIPRASFSPFLWEFQLDAPSSMMTAIKILALIFSFAIALEARSAAELSETSKASKYPENLAWLFGGDRKKLIPNDTKRTSVCETEECKMIAQVMINSMDTSVNPCDDFYQFSCGKWASNNPVPEDMEEWNMWTMVQNNIIKRVMEIIKDKVKPDDVLPVKIARKWFESCMDVETIEKRGLDPLISTMTKIGGWPMAMEVGEWDDDEYTWQKVDKYYARLRGLNFLYSVLVSEAGDEDGYGIARIDPPELAVTSYILWRDSDESCDDSEEKDIDGNEEPGSQEPGSEEPENDDHDDDHDGDHNDDDDDDNDKEDSEDEEEEDLKKKHKVSKGKAKEGKLKPTKKRNKKSSSKSDQKVHRQHKKNKKTSEKSHKRNSNGMKAPKKSIKPKKHHAKQNNVPKRQNHKLNNHAKSQRRAKRSVNGENWLQMLEESREVSTMEPKGESDETSEEQPSKTERFRKFVKEVVLAIAEARHSELSLSQLDEDIEDLINFQVQLVEIAMQDYERLGENMTLGDFQEWYDDTKPKQETANINWVVKVTDILNEANVHADESLRIDIPDGAYFKDLPALLAETSSRTIVNYIHWAFVSEMLRTTTEKMTDLYYNWDKEDKSEKKGRLKMCIEAVDAQDILAYEYVKRYFPDDIAKVARDMIDDIQKEVEYQIKDSEWMDEETKDFILAKLVNMRKLVGYPDWYNNATRVKRFFRGLNIGTSFFENTLNYEKYYVMKHLRSLLPQEGNDNEDADEWSISPLTLNAYFMPDDNALTITAADLQNPFFALGRPNALNFGIIGFIMAHEVNHGFDDTGIKYNKKGDVMEWLSAMAKAYSKRAECFVDQYNSYSLLHDKNVTIEDYGNKTIDENIADTMGLQAVYRAHRRRERECGKPDIVLPGLEDYDSDKLFFLSFANLWCEAVDENVVSVASQDEHSTGRLRVIGSVSNSVDFAKTFDCPVGSPMNPERKCSIWK